MALTYLQLPLQQWGAGNVYLLVFSSWKVNIAENPIAGCRRSGLAMQELQKFNASKQSHKPTCYPLLQSIWKTFCGIPTINKKNVMSLLKTFPMKTPPLLLWSWLGVVSMVKALKVGLKGPSMWPFLSQAMPFHWFWSCCSTLECYKGTVYI